jgi:hypothetical protein
MPESGFVEIRDQGVVWRMLRPCKHNMALRGFGLGQCTSSLPSIVTHLQPLSHRVVSILKLDLVAAGSCEDYAMGAVLAG